MARIIHNFLISNSIIHTTCDRDHLLFYNFNYIFRLFITLVGILLFSYEIKSPIVYINRTIFQN